MYSSLNIGSYYWKEKWTPFLKWCCSLTQGEFTLKNTEFRYADYIMELFEDNPDEVDIINFMHTQYELLLHTVFDYIQYKLDTQEMKFNLHFGKEYYTNEYYISLSRATDNMEVNEKLFCSTDLHSICLKERFLYFIYHKQEEILGE